MRRNGRVDLDQRAVVKALRDIGCSVQVLSGVGQGVPDLLCGYHGRTLLLEIKTGNAKLTRDESDWHARWGGHVAIVRSPEEAQIVVIRETQA